MILQLLAEPRRQAILHLLWNGERSAGDVASACDDVTFSAISQHLARLRDGGVVRVRRQGRQRFYSVDRNGLGEPLCTMLEGMWGNALARLKSLAEAEEQENRSKR